MSKTVRLFVIEYPDRDDCDVFNETLLNAVGLPLDDSLAAHFGGQGAWRTLILRKAVGGMKSAIRRKCLLPDDARGLLFDDTRWDAAQCEVVIEKWFGFPADQAQPTSAAYEALPLTLAEGIRDVIDAHLNPSSLKNPFFIKAWESKSKKSEEAPAVSPESDGATSTPE